MARSIFASLLFFVALLVGLTSSNAQGIGIGVNGTVQLNVTGVIGCSPLGNLLPIFGSPLVGVNATLSCGQGVIAQAVTDSTGAFQLTANVSNLFPLNFTACRVIVPLPVNASCILLPVVGSLQAPLTVTGMAQNVADIIVNLFTVLFVYVPPQES